MDEKQLLKQIDAFIHDNERALVKDIAALVAQRSVQEAAAGPGMPFGAGPRAALDAALRIAARMGLDAHDGDGYVGWAELPGREAGHLATVTHVDIVPEGSGWSGDALTLAEREGWLIGRGVLDDKGPTVLCLYAAKFLKEQNQTPRYGLRVLVGTNEESGMRDVAYYLARNPAPLFAFSPDAEFPVCNGEKGHYLARFLSPVVQNGNVLEFRAGLAPNVIPASASCLVRRAAAGLPESEGIAVAAENGVARITATGVGGHAARPEGAKNAIGILVAYLLDNGICAESETAYLRLLHRLHQSSAGAGLGIDCADEAFGPLTLAGGVIQLEAGRLSQTLDIRFPAAITGKELAARLAAAAAEHGASFVPDSLDEPFYLPADTPAVQTLLKSYSDVTGKAAKAFTMGGGTYARHFPRAVSFGPSEKGAGAPAFAGREHAANEGASLKAFMQALKIYILALCRLQEVDF